MTPIVGWMWSIDRQVTELNKSRDLVSRVEKIEDALFPILVEWKVQQQLKELFPDGIPGEESEEDDAGSEPPPPEKVKELKERLRKDADDWANKQIQQRPMKGD
jgi:hypothetical protein